MKRILSAFLAIVLVFNWMILPACAQTAVQEEKSLVSKKLENEMKSCISKIYGSENTEEIYANVYKLIEITTYGHPKYLTH